ncbi:hypothetical protein NE236_07925 [Actinoallomurus purpureus]|uniref:hypothetical protein n=1 Tax=Actinoallomurus purpureus TaxID=478114 RepID=UPI0020929C19|nr:hypothetical protein [Actinoallomurus purpureus]MCO6004906.1 hypothetical protein [Actinoallomurus purpureus]
MASLVMVGASPEAATADDYKEICAGPVAELKAVHEKISAHNARQAPGGVSTDASAVASYNAEAETLRFQQNQAFARLMACERAFDRMKANHPLSTVVTPSPADLSKIAAAVSRLTDEEKRAGARWNPKTYDFLNYGTGKRGMTKRVDRAPADLRKTSPTIYAVYKALDKSRPRVPSTAYLQGVQAPKIGSSDPAYQGRRINSVAFDHIIPLRRLVVLPNFPKLTPRNMYIVANSPANTQWLSGSANSSKLSGSSAFISGADPAWIQAQAKLREKTEMEVQELIDALLKSQRA